LIVIVAVLDVPASVAVSVTDELAETARVGILNVAVEAPAGTVMDPGIVALALVVDKAIDTPPGPAAPLSVTVPVDAVPPTTVAGLTLKAVRVAKLTVRVAVF